MLHTQQNSQMLRWQILISATSLSHETGTNITLTTHQSQFATLTIVKFVLALDLLMHII